MFLVSHIIYCTILAQNENLFKRKILVLRHTNCSLSHFILLIVFYLLANQSVNAETNSAKFRTTTQPSFQGITEPFRQAIISAYFASDITSIIKKEGTFVRKGDTIIELDFREAQLDAERCRIIAESEAELQAAKLKAETAEQDYKATKTLHDSTRAVSGEELWKKELDYNLTKTEREHLSMIKSKEILEYKMALERLSHYFIIAPFNGIIAQHFLNESESCKPQEQLVKIVDIQKCRFITYIPVALSQDLEKGKSVAISLECKNAPLIRRGIVEFISPIVDASSGLRTVKIVFENKDGTIQPGIKGSLLIDRK